MAQVESRLQDDNAVAPPPGSGKQSWIRRNWWVVAGLVIAAAVVVFLAPAASSDPDGLDRVSEDKAFAEQGKDPGFELLPDYTIPGIDNEWATVVLAGLVGVAIVFVVPVGIGYVLRQSRKASS
ncbi:MAG: PDGLE domain-containing protein [Dehalococcoidia bacterium]|nr:PDGLE domain-containing protein [Dehalococcoidia bacterium]